MIRGERNLNYRETEASLGNVPILKFEHYEQILKLRSLERESAIKKAQIGAASEGRLDKYEDAAWEYARLEEFKTTRQVIDLRHKIRKLRIIEIDETQKPELVRIGALVKLRNITEDLEETFLISGTSGNGRISTGTPLVGELLSRKQHQIVEVTTPGGSTKYKILEICWGTREYLRDYLPKYVKREIPSIEGINSKVSLEEPGVLKVSRVGDRRDLVKVLRRKSYLTDTADKIEYIITVTKEYNLIIPEVDQCKIVLDKIKNLFEQAEISYTPPF